MTLNNKPRLQPVVVEEEPRGNTTMMTGSQMVGDGDEDSEGIENVREEMFTYSQDLVRDLDRKLTKLISAEVDRVLGVLGKYREVVEKRLGDLHTFLDELKDENDRLGERLKSQQGELLTYNKNVGNMFKRVRGD